MYVIVYFFRSAISPPTWGSQPKSPVSHANSQNHQKYLLGATGVDPNNPDAGTRVPTKSANFQVPKRTGSPILSSAEVLLESSPSIQDDGERFFFFFLPVRVWVGGVSIWLSFAGVFSAHSSQIRFPHHILIDFQLQRSTSQG